MLLTSQQAVMFPEIMPVPFHINWPHEDALPWIFQLQQIELSEMTNAILSFNVVGENVLCCLAVSFSIETSQTFGFP